MKHVFIPLTFLCISTSVWSQIDDKPQLSLSIPAIESENGKATETNSLNIEPLEAPTVNELDASNKVNGLTVSKRDNLNVEEEFSMFNKKKFANPAELFQDNLSKQLEMPNTEAVNPNAVGSLVDQYFGDFETKSGKVNIIYRDHQAFDGDRVMVYVNDDIIKSNVLLTSGFSGITVDLQPGLNKIEFQALNTGSSGPNTAEFRILDDDGNFIAGNTWNLAKGVKGSIIIVKQQ
ncbi:hypothetical protein [Formosa algae]|uniref:Secreted protein n=1 Tax=Formosa algae TaxID=225843 RepID=A0A9X0YLE1_9FLAO|nr:hypothetical protein [Formosa algae]MBP1841185.1 hypothetical protein [Formosa algae]MDQ0336395.1 hypothetical protein [Formosa algae]OEI81360.1 hypothetical protein AST99_03755 [Formosa algae]PNW27900.1 hypothetical protein BKP44_10775 [Formosa algae]